jgi:hypothetical protein
MRERVSTTLQQLINYKNEQTEKLKIVQDKHAKSLKHKENLLASS